MAEVFPDEAAYLLLLLALIMKFGEECQIGKYYCAGKALDY